MKTKKKTTIGYTEPGVLTEVIFVKKDKTGEEQPFHLVSISPWPLMTSLALLSLALSIVSWMHFGGSILIVIVNFGIFAFFRVLLLWRSDINAEGDVEGSHTFQVQQGIRYGMLLFILSEVMFFFGFFWSYFHSSMSPSITLGCIWPPVGVHALDPFALPLVNTFILLGSAVSITAAHANLSAGRRSWAVAAIILTLGLGWVFTALQGDEYGSSTFDINDGTYGSTFYMATGFHGFHVIMGTFLILLALLRLLFWDTSPQHHVGFEAAAWYWHFVDVVWLGLFVCMYWLGQN